MMGSGSSRLQQLGDELQLPLAGDVGADAAGFADRCAHRFVQRHLGQQGRAQADQAGSQRLDLERIAPRWLLLGFALGLSSRYTLLSAHVLYQDSR
jgi:hypothetical protein